MRLRVRVAALQDGWPEARVRLTELEKTAPAKWLVQLDGPVWCIAGNVVEPRPSGPGVRMRRFKRQFKRNAKVYLAHLQNSDAILASEPMPWHRISVVGPQGKSTGWIECIVSAWHVTNWRVELVDEPGALVQLKKEEWSGFGLQRGAFVCPEDKASPEALRGLLAALGVQLA